MFKDLYDEKKAAQVAAYFLFRAGGSLTILKLMKLMYMAERQSFAEYGEPIIGDRLVSMDNGPVLSRTYSHMNGEYLSVVGGWDDWVADRESHFLSLKDGVRIDRPRNDLQELSDADLAVLDHVWGDFGKMDQWDLVRYTHRHFPEWTDPHGSMVPMSYEQLFSALGYNNEAREAIISHLREQAELNGALQSFAEA
jgi:uncharacterized phage-associated protein